MKTILITVKGKVQGVFYRQTTKEIATGLGITGEVKNLSNGDVRIIATGTEEQLQGLTTWCRKGPERAVVSQVLTEEVPTQSFDKFKVVR
jgi:acylphosphatase